MALTARDIGMNADLFRLSYPSWPHPEPERSASVEFRYCPVCRRQGNDDSRMGIERVWNVEGAGPEGLIADVCENGHVFPIENEED
jgi:hypothetical protein